MNKEQLKQHLLPQEVKDNLPKLYSTERLEDPEVKIKFFCPWSNWTWYATEGQEDEDGDFRFFGLTDGHEKELGYFVLSELMSVRGPGGLTIERDLHFKPQPLSNFK
jgi:hypothetical protein